MLRPPEAVTGKLVVVLFHGPDIGAVVLMGEPDDSDPRTADGDDKLAGTVPVGPDESLIVGVEVIVPFQDLDI